MKAASVLFTTLSAQAYAGLVPRAPMAYQDYGELRLAVTADYTNVYDDGGTGAKRDFGLWHPKPQDPNFLPLGSVGEGNHDAINGQRATLVAALNPAVKPQNPAMPALKEPTGWTLMWNDKKSGGKRDGSIWRPTCATGYVSNLSPVPPLAGVVGGPRHRRPGKRCAGGSCRHDGNERDDAEQGGVALRGHECLWMGGGWCGR
ncbi:hypothetical protein NLG97_g1748 [Lecanicillium saksenae]|uniref:Uncharacterized protein n=1 Tax=Lecanicillium saksenae TaxID=468837 RepID=A0ACC1R2W8_9HYPO|nr:hypothetical protein NLG97_g1748 [Lecanicillium saksenae]